MFLCSWPLALLLVFLQVSSRLVQGSKKQKLSPTERVTSFFPDQHSKTTQLPTHTRASANTAEKQIHGKMEGGIAATLICISLSYHKPDFNKQCYNCVFCPELKILPTYKQWCHEDLTMIRDSFGGHTIIPDVISYDFDKTWSVVSRDPLTRRDSFCWKWEAF